MAKMEDVYRKKLLSRKGRVNLTGMTFEHWSDKDMAEDGQAECRVWHKLGGMTIKAGPTSIRLAMDRPWCWQVTLMAKMRDGTIEQTEIDIKSPLKLQEIDDFLHSERTALLLEHDDYVAKGWRARIVS